MGTSPELRDIPPKGGVIPDTPVFALRFQHKAAPRLRPQGPATAQPVRICEHRAKPGKDFSVREGPVPYQLVGKVTAYQDYDG